MSTLRLEAALLAVTVAGLLVDRSAVEAPAAPHGERVAEAQIAVAALSPGREPVPGAYLAAVAEDSPWRQPAREAVIAEGGSVSWALPAGRYGFVAGAPGYSLEYLDPIALGAGPNPPVEITLAKLDAARGRIVGTQGEGVPAARVSDLRAVVFGHDRVLSPLGEEHLAGNFQVSSRQDGSFDFPLHPEAGHFLLVEAEGFCPRYLPNVRASGSGRLRPIHLDQGASLTVRLGPASEVPALYDRLQLVPKGALPRDGLSLEGALALWARPAGGGRALWPSLPPGRFELWLKAPPHGAHRATPIYLASLDLEPGARRAADLALPKAIVEPTAPPAASAPTVSLLVRGASLAQGAGVALLRWSGAALEPLAAGATAVSGGVRLHAVGGCQVGARFLAAADAWAALTGPVAEAPCREPLVAEAFSRATAVATLKPPAQHRLPGTATLRVSPCATARGANAASATRAQVLPVAVGAGGRLVTPLPAGCSDLTLSVADFAPLAWQRQEVAAGGTLQLGRHQLRAGGAVLARVVGAADGRAVEGARVAAVEGSQADPLLHLPADEREARALASGTTDRDGWVRLFGLPASELVLLLDAPRRRFPHVTESFSVRSGEERLLDPVELPPVASLHVDIEVAADFDREETEPVEVAVQRLGSPGAPGGFPLYERIAPGQGAIEFAELPPGRFNLIGLARDASGKKLPMAQTECEVAAGSAATARLVFAVRLYRGRVSYLGAPVEGTVTLTPLSLDGRRKLTVRLDAEGKFRVPLERPGHYKAEVSDLEGRLSPGIVPAVHFEEPQLEVEIEVPAGRVSGLVMEESGEPAAGARVSAKSARDRPGDGGGDGIEIFDRAAKTGRAGEFTFEGVPPGSWLLTARRESQSSQPLVVALNADEQVAGVRLELRPLREVRGVIVDSAGQGVAGALGYANVPPRLAGADFSHARFETDVQGEFSFELGTTAEWVDLQVRTPQGLAFASRQPLAERLTVTVPAAGSSARLRIDAADLDPRKNVSYWLVARDGAYLGLHFAASANPGADGRASEFTISALPVGEWRLVRVASVQELALMYSGAGVALPTKAVLISQPGEVLEVDLLARATTQ